METYLFKSACCWAILYGFYLLFLERESMHGFKRYYLLGSLLIGAFIPLITFTEYVVLDDSLANTININTAGGAEAEFAGSTSWLINSLIAIYAFGVLLFGFRFLRNLNTLWLRILKNPRLKAAKTSYVLLQHLVIPHTFFSYIFVNKKKFVLKEIPQAVLLHEQAHAEQKHSVDVIFAELLQVFFWFNPLVYLYKKSIKLNHEFLADSAVLKAGYETANYQETLLQYSIGTNTPDLANAINYSSFKKRFTVMKNKSSKPSSLAKGLLLLPIIALLTYSFSTTKYVMPKPEVTVNNQKAINQSNSLQADNRMAGDPITIVIQGKTVSINGKQTSVKKFAETLDNITKNWKAADFNNADLNIKISNVDKAFMKKLNDAYKQTKLYQANPNSYGLVPPPPPPPPAPDKAPKAGNVFIEEIIETPETEEVIIKEIEFKNEFIEEDEVEVEKVIDVKRGVNVIVERVKPVIEEIEIVDVTPPPPPPPPKNPTDAIIDLAKEGAKFMLNGKEISSDKALKLAKSNKLNAIDVVKKSGETTIVNLEM